jgi:hypothetical protein
MFPSEISNIPGQIEAALRFLHFTEEIVAPKNYSGPPVSGRDLTKTEFEVKDSALTVLLEYFNQPVPTADHRHKVNPPVADKQDDLPI